MIRSILQYFVNLFFHILNEPEKTLGVARGGHWPAFKKEHEKLFPKVCAACGTTKGNIELHHIVPFHNNPSKECDHKNVVWLCEDPALGNHCHLYHGHNKKWRGWNTHVLEDAATFLTRVAESEKLSKEENHYDRA